MTFMFKNYSNRKNIKVVKTTASSAIEQNLTSAYQYVNGSRISYTPLSAESKVIYEFYCAYSYFDTDNHVRFRLQIGDTLTTLGDVDSTNNNNYINAIGSNYSSGTARMNGLVTLRYVLNSWQNEKMWQIEAESRSTAYQAGLHRTNRHGGSGDFGTKYFNPFVICYEV